MSLKRQKRSIQKRSFLLFELLLAIGLLLVCFFPMIKTHVGIAKEEAKQVRALREELLVQEKFCDFKTLLHEHAYSWGELMKEGEKGSFFVTKLDQSIKNNNESGLLLNVALSLGDKTYERTVYVKKARNDSN